MRDEEAILNPSTNDRVVRVGIAGLGRSGWSIHATTLEQLPEQFRVVAVCDLDPARRAEAEARLGCRAYAEIEELVRDREVDLVVVAAAALEEPTPDRGYNREELPWVEETADLSKEGHRASNKRLYHDLYATLRQGAPLQITTESILRQIAVLEKCRALTLVTAS